MSKDNQQQNQEEVGFSHLGGQWRVFIVEAFLFSLILGLGIFTGLRLSGVLVIEGVFPRIEISPISPFSPNIKIPLSGSSLSLIQFLFYFLFALLFVFFIFFVLKSKRIKKIILKILFVLTTGLGGILSLGAWHMGPIILFVIGFLIFLWLQTKSILVHNLLLILGIVGMGSAVGLRIEPWTGVFILMIFSVYDYIAVYKTKHMIKMAKEMIESKAILALVVPPDLLGFQESLEEIRPGGKFLILGGGDIVFPLLFSASLIPTGITNSIIVAIFALIGLFAGFYFFVKQKVRQPIPALPPIAFFLIIGFLITRLIQ